jgi:hypothetical protein
MSPPSSNLSKRFEMQHKCTVVTVILLVCVSTLHAQEMVENPEYISWSKFKKGTSVVMKSTNEFKGMNSEVITTTNLIDVGTDKLVLESSSVVKGKVDFKSEPEKREVKRVIPLLKGLTMEDVAAGKPPGTSEEGIETLKLGNQEFRTRWYKYSADVDGVKTAAKRWVSSEVPGNIVKSEMTTTGALTSTIKLELVEIKK